MAVESRFGDEDFEGTLRFHFFTGLYAVGRLVLAEHTPQHPTGDTVKTLAHARQEALQAAQARQS